ncbi:MAG: sigma-70 family RNA polymerase sigma factor [Ferruginibacter sp.]
MSQADQIFFTEIYTKHAPQVLHMCMAYTDNEALAQDLMQETFVKVWQNIRQFRGEAKISTWIYRIAINTCLGHLRSPKNAAPAELKETFDRADENGSIQKEQDIQELYRAIHQLPEADRLIISMVLEAIPYEEIAASLNISEGNLRVKIHRIKQELTKLFFNNEQL